MQQPELFEALACDRNSYARTGKLRLHGTSIETPMFMPVGTAGSVKAIELKDLRDLGYALILGNTYHLYLRLDRGLLNSLTSLHTFLHWDTAILSDSGGYQVMSLKGLRSISEEGVIFQSHIDGSRHLFSPESVVEFQQALKSDVQMVLDICSSPGIPFEEARDSMEQTHRWAKRARLAFEKYLPEPSPWKLNQFGIIQGGFYTKLRDRSAEFIQSLPFEGIAIGGLAVGEPFKEFSVQLQNLAPKLDKKRAHYVLGIGSPDFIIEAVRYGIDIFDSVYPTRCARNAQLLTQEGRINIRNARYARDTRILPSFYPELQGYTYAYLHHLFKAKEILAAMIASQVNLRYMFEFCQNMRKAITRGDFDQFAEHTLALFAR